ncbi:MAG: steroid delta-isomerase-like uncharacterized protein [Parasphingorhabdus sp.]|jgi:steroid delta-isomerase-like uncharacterized protein
MNRERMQAVVEKLHAIWNTGDVSLVPEVYASDFVVHWLSHVPPQESYGWEGVIEAIEATRVKFPDWHEDVVDIMIDGNRVVTRYESTGTHKGEYKGVAPTGRKIELQEVSIYRIEDGLIAEQWCADNEPCLMQQISPSMR